MNPLIKTLLLSYFSIFLGQVAFAQIPQKNDSASFKKEVSFPPLTDLIDSAIKQSAMVRYRNLEIDVKASNLSTQRNYWLRNLGLQADTRYGTYDNFSSNAVGGQSTTLLNSTSRQFNYGVGLFVKLPIFDFVNRKVQIKQAKTELEQSKSMAVALEDEIRQLVIRQYQDLLLKQKLLNIKSQNLGSATVNMEMVEKQFRNGVIAIAEYVRISDLTSRIQADYEVAKSDFLLSKQILEDMVGFTFNNPDLR